MLDSLSSTVGVAQLVELLVVVQAVGGSSPLAHPRETALVTAIKPDIGGSTSSAVSINCPSIFFSGVRFRPRIPQDPALG